MKKQIAVAMCLATVSSMCSKEIIQLKDLTVTAQKQDENYIDVPISLNVFDEFQIEDKKIDTIQDLANNASNLIFLDAGGSGVLSPFIRGIASDTGVENSNVAIYLDGIPYVNTFGNEILLENVKRIEVLKGPQSVLYGKNSYAGVINIISKEPTKNFHGDITLELGSDNKKSYSLSLNTPLSEKFLMNLFYKHNQKDGFITNNNLNNKDNFEESDFGKIHVKYIHSDNLDFSLISSILKNDNGAPSWNIPTATDLRQTNSNFQGKNDLSTNTNAFKINYNFEGFKFSSISTYKKYDNATSYDADFSAQTFNHVIGDTNTKEFSQEFRLSKTQENYKYLLGLYADNMKKQRDIKIITMPFQNYETKSKTLSAFANIDYAFSKKIALSLGGRIDKDTIDLNDNLLNVNDNNSYTNFSPKATLKYKMDENTMFYSTISKGYKAGGYYLFAPTLDQRWVKKESLINYEIGAKSYLDNLTLSFSAFFMDIKDKQVSTHIDPLYSFVQNAAKAESKGFELDLDYKVNDTLNLYSHFGYSNSTLKEFSDSQGDYSGNKNPFSPKYTYSLGAQYRNANGIFATVNLKGQSKMYSDKQNQLTTKAFNIVNTKIGYEQANYEIYLYANNIGDKKYDTSYGAVTFLSKPREIGIQLKYRF